MSESVSHPQAVHADLDQWLQSRGGEERELIVEARLRERKLAVGRVLGGKPTFRNAGPDRNRSAHLEALRNLIAEAVRSEPVLLRAAGAVAVRATPDEVRKFASSPLIRAIRPNRRLFVPLDGA